jgi:hypothetical protein
MMDPICTGTQEGVMGEVIHTKGKAREASEDIMSEYHDAKQKATKKWSGWMRDRNPDCYILDGCIVLRLDKCITLEDAEEASKIDDVYVARGGIAYGLVPTK